MVKRVPADIADIVYSGPVRAYATNCGAYPNRSIFAYTRLGAGDLGIRRQLLLKQNPGVCFSNGRDIIGLRNYNFTAVERENRMLFDPAAIPDGQCDDTDTMLDLYS